MNEVTQIHLGRQPFTIAVDAHKALQAYLAEIKNQVGDKSTDVVKEVELRMAELLGERGVSGDKVILMDDVTFLKQQLGEPQDFKEDASEAGPVPPISEATSKRLFRDTEHGMVAGVAAGLATYFRLDVLLIRILFVLAILSGGWGILLYIALWLVIPEARSSSERLQMRGLAVTVDSLKETVERADFHGAAHRAGNTVGPWINSAFRLALKVTGIAFILTALSAIFGIIVTGIYFSLHNVSFFNVQFFPVSSEDRLLVIIALVWAGLVSLFLLLVGLAMVRRKWPIASWATGVLLGVLFIGLAVGLALAGDTAPKIRQRYQAAHHSITRTVQPFSGVDTNVRIEHGDSYAVMFRYIGNPDISRIKTTVVNNKLTIDTQDFFKQSLKCNAICLFPDYNLQITVYSPTFPTVTSDDVPSAIIPPVPAITPNPN